MLSLTRRFSLLLGTCALLVFAFTAPTLSWLPASAHPTGSVAQSSFYQQINLVSDQPGKAKFRDPNLINPWGVSYSPTSPFWVSDAGTGVSTLYDTRGTPLPLIVTIPGHGKAKGAPTGQVFNGTKGFVIGKGKNARPSLFIFDTLNGTIAGWNSTVDPTHALLTVDESATGAVFTGLAIAKGTGGIELFAADITRNQVEVFDSAFHKVNSFTDPKLPKGFGPFGVQNINGKIYVAFASLKDGAGRGYVDVFNTSGMLLKRLIAGGTLNSPWGLALAPAGFGQFSNDLLVGNFGDGRINAFDPLTGKFLGTIKDKDGKPIVLERLWAIIFGNGGRGGDRNTLYFTAGIGAEKHGLFGSIQAQTSTAKPVTRSITITTDSSGTFVFSPAQLTVSVGTTVVWKNSTQSPHTVTSDDGTSFDSGTIDPGGSFSFTFTKTGKFPYHCNIHPFMMATITVR